MVDSTGTIDGIDSVMFGTRKRLLFLDCPGQYQKVAFREMSMNRREPGKGSNYTCP